jgi:hypothetical protein
LKKCSAASRIPFYTLLYDATEITYTLSFLDPEALMRGKGVHDDQKHYDQGEMQIPESARLASSSAPIFKLYFVRLEKGEKGSIENRNLFTKH